VDAEPQLHRVLGLYEGLWQIGGPWPNLSPIQGAFIARAGGRGFQRPFELATVRLLSNMSEVLGHWRTYSPEADDTLVYSYRDRGILGFSETMSRPLSFLDPFLG